MSSCTSALHKRLLWLECNPVTSKALAIFSCPWSWVSSHSSALLLFETLLIRRRNRFQEEHKWCLFILRQPSKGADLGDSLRCPQSWPNPWMLKIFCSSWATCLCFPVGDPHCSVEKPLCVTVLPIVYTWASGTILWSSSHQKFFLISLIFLDYIQNRLNPFHPFSQKTSTK